MKQRPPRSIPENEKQDDELPRELKLQNNKTSNDCAPRHGTKNSRRGEMKQMNGARILHVLLIPHVRKKCILAAKLLGEVRA